MWLGKMTPLGAAEEGIPIGWPQNVPWPGWQAMKPPLWPAGWAWPLYGFPDQPPPNWPTNVVPWPPPAPPGWPAGVAWPPLPPPPPQEQPKQTPPPPSPTPSKAPPASSSGVGGGVLVAAGLLVVGALFLMSRPQS